ncbi:SDR family NAD(P)-dependent oxidoreductase [Xylanimonas allomyrinae]|nr:SDR family NAD(P)-dependent oxidoreductase [Xylanimonas allomyrinae]
MTTQRVAIVTGAAGGLGLAVAKQLGEDGYALFLLDRDADGLRASADVLRADGYTTDTEVCDLTDSASVARAVDAHTRLGTLKALANIAGIWARGRLAEVSVEDFDLLVGIKLRGDFLTIKSAIPWMQQNGGGAIVNISSMSGRTSSQQTSTSYVAANAGIIGLTMSAAKQYAVDNIRVNCIAPGMIDTPMMANYTPEELGAICREIPLGRLSDPSEIADVVSFLISEKASYITGETINANGGMFMV